MPVKEFFRDLFVDLYENFTEIFLNVLIMAMVMIGGVVISWLIKRLVSKLLVLFRFDKWAENTGIANFLNKGGVTVPPSTVLSRIIYWVFIVAFFSFGLNFIGITQFSEYLSKFTAALPLIVVSLIILIIGIIFSNFLSRLIFLACENAKVKYGELIAKGAKVFLIIITFGIVFEYIGVGNTIITISVLIIFGGIVLALSLALGIGLSNVIGELIRDKMKSMEDKKGKGA